MRHHDKRSKLGREKNVRNALMKSLMIALIRESRISTTEAKARALRPYAEKFITLAKNGGGSLASRRIIASRLTNRWEEAKKLVEEIAPKFKDRNGGYTRIIKLPRRASDGAKVAIIEFVD